MSFGGSVMRRESLGTGHNLQMNPPRMTTITALRRAATLVSLRQRVADLRERSLLGGLFYVFSWGLIVAFSDGFETYPRTTVSAGLLLLALAALRFLPESTLPNEQAAARAQNRIWTVLICTAALWGALMVWAWLDPAFAEARALILLGVVSLATAFAQIFAVGRKLAFLGTALMVLPMLGALVYSVENIGLLLMMAVNSLYLVGVIFRSNAEYESRLALEVELRTERDRYVRLSRLDALSGLANRGHFQTVFDAATAAHESGAVLLVLDVDRFKQVNDRYGHSAGDRVIIGVGEALRECLQGLDGLPARLGGEEFGAVIRGVDASRGLAVAEDLRRRVNAMNFTLADGSEFRVTASIGVGAFDPQRHRDSDALYREVDAALYRAKEGGRNRVVSIN